MQTNTLVHACDSQLRYGARNDGSVTASQHAACEAILLGMFMAHMRQVDSILIMSNEQSVIKQMRVSR